MNSEIISSLSLLMDGTSVLETSLTEENFIEAMLPLAQTLQTNQIPYDDEKEQDRIIQQLHQEFRKLMEGLPSSVEPSHCMLYVYSQQEHIIAKAFSGRIPDSVLYAAFSSISTAGSIAMDIPFLQGENYLHKVTDSVESVTQSLHSVSQREGILAVPTRGQTLSNVLDLFVRMDVLPRNSCKQMMHDVQYKYHLSEMVCVRRKRDTWYLAPIPQDQVSTLGLLWNPVYVLETLSPQTVVRIKKEIRCAH